MRYVECIRGYFYYRRGGKRWRLHGEPGSRQFLKDYQEATAEFAGAVPFGVIDSFSSVLDAYLDSPEFEDKAPGTQKNYKVYIKKLRPAFGPFPIKDIKRKHVKIYRDSISKKRGAANQAVRVMMAVCAWAIDADLIEVNPAANIRSLKGGERLPWPDALIERFFIEAPKELAWAVAMGLWTGQRKGDCLKARWKDIEGGGIHFTQEKTGKQVWIPILPDLEAVLASINKRSLIILTSTKGRVWSKPGFDAAFSKCMKKMGVTGYVFHGLRKNAAKNLAEAGCTTEEIKAWTGHSDEMAGYYARGADQKRLATSALSKLIRKNDESAN
jgi:integrase